MPEREELEVSTKICSFVGQRNNQVSDFELY
jgi:hypothetical protein